MSDLMGNPEDMFSCIMAPAPPVCIVVMGIEGTYTVLLYELAFTKA